jgi:hypothetical protein
MSEHQDEDFEIELPPAVMALVSQLEADQRKLLKDKSFGSADQLRKFLATTLLERFTVMVKMFGTTLYDLHQLSGSNAMEIRAMRRWTAKHLRELGAEVSDGEPFAGVGTEEINAVSQCLYALGSYLQEKYPADKQLEAHYNALASSLAELMDALMGDQSHEEDDEGDDEGDDRPEENESEGEGGGGEGEDEPDLSDPDEQPDGGADA